MNILELTPLQVFPLLQENGSAGLQQTLFGDDGQPIGAVIYVFGRLETPEMLKAVDAVSDQWREESKVVVKETGDAVISFDLPPLIEAARAELGQGENAEAPSDWEKVQVQRGTRKNGELPPLDNSHHKPITVTLLDTATGATAVVHDVSTWQWTEGNWACDCNRASYFDIDQGDEKHCAGCHRFLVKELGDDGGDIPTDCGISDFNEGYPLELLAQHLP